jgi:hypothetical protein
MLTIANEFINVLLRDLVLHGLCEEKPPFADFKERQVDGVQRQHRDARVEQNFQPTCAQLRRQACDQGARNSCQQVLQHKHTNKLVQLHT